MIWKGLAVIYKQIYTDVTAMTINWLYQSGLYSTATVKLRPLFASMNRQNFISGSDDVFATWSVAAVLWHQFLLLDLMP